MSDQARKVMISLSGVRKTFPPPARHRKRDGEPPRAVSVEVDDLKVHEGELLALLGGSGSGKTTTLKMINRLTEPDEGTVEVVGRRTVFRGGRLVEGEPSPEKLRRQIGYVIQSSGLFLHLTVYDNVAVVPRLLGWDKPRIDARIEELMKLMRLDTDVLRRFARQLSGGMQQRVGFARALAARPPLMLMDEPFGALDPIVREEVRTEFQAIRARENLTAVMVTHDMTEALRMADRIAVMEQGRVVQVGPPRELLTRPKTDYVQKLIQGPLDETKRIEEFLADQRAGGEA